jgi:Reverse transcriptase (RNA-dependent DNA polymerase)
MQGVMKGLPIKLGTTGKSWKLKWVQRKIEARKTSISQHWAQQMGKDQSKIWIPDKFVKYKEVFSEEAAKRFPPERPEDHKIELLPGAPWRIGGEIYKLMDEEWKAMTNFLQEQQEKGYMTRSNSRWASPFFYIKKKDGRLRPVFDYHKVNKWTIKDVYPLPQINMIFDQIREAKLMSKFDIRDGYYNIWVHPDSWWATAVATEEGLFESRVMTFGLCNAPATFQRMMDQCFSPIKQKYPKWIHWYMDNVIIATPDDQELHDHITGEFLVVMKKESLFLKLEKCRFGERQVEFLGYVIDQGTICIGPSKKHGLEEWPRELKSVKEVHSTLGVLGYQHQFIPNFAHIAQPLTALLKKGIKFQWTQECTNTVDALINCVTWDPVLQRPDTTKPFVLEVDVS